MGNYVTCKNYTKKRTKWLQKFSEHPFLINCKNPCRFRALDSIVNDTNNQNFFQSLSRRMDQVTKMLEDQTLMNQQQQQEILVSIWNIKFSINI